MIELSRLVFLEAVHRHGSVARAAAVLGYTPSAVSQQISKLEREAGTTLLEPVGRGVLLTDAALVLVDTAVAVGAARETAEAALEALAGELVGSLRVAAFPSAVRGLVAPALGTLASAAPGLRTRLLELAPEPGLLAALDGRVDVAVVHDWVDDRTTFPAEVERVHLLDDPVDLVVPARHPLVDEGAVTIEEAADERWVTDVSDSITTRWIIDLLTASGHRDHLRHRAEEYASQLALIGAGLGVGVLPRLGRPALPDTVRVLTLAGHVPVRRVFAVFRRSTSRRPAVGRLVAELEAMASRAGGPHEAPDAPVRTSSSPGRHPRAGRPGGRGR